MLSDYRRIGISETLHGLAQDPVLVRFALLTQLGDVWFLFLLGGVHYVVGDKFLQWGIDRRRGLFVLGLLLTYVTLVGVLSRLSWSRDRRERVPRRTFNGFRLPFKGCSLAFRREGGMGFQAATPSGVRWCGVDSRSLSEK